MKSSTLKIAALFILLAALFTPSCLEDLAIDDVDCGCQNGGYCIDNTCDCPPGYTGIYCETYVGTPPVGCPFEQQTLSENQIRAALQSFTYDGTANSTITEAREMLKHICSSINQHAGDGGYVCGRMSNGKHITIWINTYNKPGTYGIRYNSTDNHTHFSSNNSYFEIAKTGNGGNAPTQTTPNTIFKGVTAKNFTTAGEWWMESFTISSSTSLVLRFASTYSADCAIITQDQVNNFKNGSNVTGYALFDNQYGYKSVTLSAGTYYLAVRNQSSAQNTFTAELDYRISLPASDKCTYFDEYITGVKTLQAGQRLWHPFTVQAGYRYFIDGCNSGMYVFFIPENQLSIFQSGGNFQHYPDYSTPNDVGGDPGLFEIKLPPGTYYMASYNYSNVQQSLVYNMERWRQN